MLQIEHLSFDVRDEGRQAEILSDISFNVADGEMLVITGPNGGGKSTLAKLLMGINEATSGRIILNGEDITDLSINERAQAGIGFAFQQPPRFKGMTVRRLLNLAAGRTLSESECCGFLSSVGLCAQEYIDREADATLSGGEMKRIEIATVLAKQHALCIFDEPEAGIDL
ncbi:MAG: ATP-binding cassette domain-containing protein, partial [Coprococcus catus]|nr:ATP-binding cassette domain-containing protein [Coprococcus catus]